MADLKKETLAQSPEYSVSKSKRYDPFASDSITDLDERLPGTISNPPGGSTKYSVAVIQQAIQAGSDFQIIPPGQTGMVIPAGSKGIIVRTEFNSDASVQINELSAELLQVKSISSQDDAAFANKILAKAKKVIKFLGAERLIMSSVLKAEADNLIEYERGIVSELQDTYDVVTKSVLEYQQKVFEENKRKEAEIQRQKAEQLQAIQAEADRKSEIKTYLLNFEKNVLTAMQNATIDDIDSKIQMLSDIKMTEEDCMEFLPEAEIMYQSCVTKMNARKTELLQLSQAVKTNKAEAERLQAIQEAKAVADSAALARRSEMAQEELADMQQAEISNVQMTAELKSSLKATPKGIAVLWVFDEDNIDLSLLPDEYKTFDKDKIKKAIGAGCREIPGVNVYEKLSNRPK